MNNNNLYNTNNFIGITHNDYFKTASNALAKAINSLELNSSNYTSNVSNILNTNSSNYTRNTSNAILARYDPMIEKKTEAVSVNTPLLMNPMPLDLYHTYISNSNVIGEIRFWCKSTPLFPIPVSVGVPDYRVKIDVDGKLKIYYTYDPFVSLTIGNGWIDVHTTLVSLIASDINIGVTTAALEAQIQNNFATIQEQFAALFCNLYEDDIITSNMRNRIEQDTAEILASSTVTTTTGTLEQLYTYMSAFYRTQRISRLTQAANLINLRISQNAAAAFFLGIGGVALSFMYGISQADSHNDYINTILNGAITSNLFLSKEQKRVLYDSNILSMMSNYIDQLEYTSNISAIQGFINTYNTNQQTIPSLLTSTLNLNSGNITQINTINGTTGIFGTISTTNNNNTAIPSLGNFGGIGDKMIIKTGSSTLYPYAIGTETNALWISSEDNINFYNKGIKTLSLTSDNNIVANNKNISNINTITAANGNISNLKCDILTLNNGNISNINGISANEIIAAGKIKQNGILLDNTYLTSNHLYNLSLNYTTERQYPSKAYTIAQLQDTVSLLGKLVYHQTLYLDNQTIAYGSGIYEVYSSSSYDTPTTKDRLFNFNTTETTTSPRWAISLYNSGTGNYQGDNSIDNVYFGDWIILKLPQPILLTRYRIYQRSDFLTKAPAEWKVYGSNDGITFIEITEASQTTRLTSYTGGYYEKSLNPSFIIQYQYIGYTFKSLLSTSGQTDLSFSELQIFGKEIISNSITSQIYTTSNVVKGIVQYEMPIVAKHYGFYISITTPIIIGTTTYYKYDINLTPYCNKGIIQIGPQSGDTFRSFKIRVMLGTMYFSYIINDLPNVCYYEVFMSYKNTAAPPNGVAGLNACAIGYPHNPTLQTIMPNNLFVIKNGAGSIDYITVVATSPADVRVIIEDLIG